MKTYKLSILFLFVFLAIQGINAQSVYNIGGHSIYYNDGQYFKITSNDTIPIIKDKIIIKFKDNISEVDKNIFSSDFGLTYVNASKHGITVYLIDETNNFLDFIAALSTDVRIKYYDLNFELSYFNIEPPNNDVPESIWNSNEEVMWPYDNTQLYDAWSITHGIPEIIVANLDNGIVLNHEDLGKGFDLYSNIWVNKNEIPGNGIDDDENKYIDDYNGWNFGIINQLYGNNDVTHYNPQSYRHGTMTSGVISAKTNNGRGVFGIAGGWKSEGVKTMMVKTATINDKVEMAQIPAAIDYAVMNGARIINMAWGSDTLIESIEHVISTYYNEDNVTFLAAVGNNDGSSIAYPASSEYVIAVGATENIYNTVEKRWSDVGEKGSNYGDGLEVMAPGSLMLISLSPNEDGEYTYNTQDETPKFCNTSSAVSFVSGVVALMLSANPCLTNEEIRMILRNTSDKITGGYKYYKYDLYPNRPGFCEWMGYGRINAKKALEQCVFGVPVTIINPESYWNSDQTIYYDLTIENGGVLKISDCSISVFPNAKIIVKPGGKLIVDNANIQGICGYIWQGIEVWGNSDEPQWPNSSGQYNQGYVELNNAVIENAVCALNLWKPGDDYSTTGGIVHATKTVFKNNVKSLHALLYKNFHPVNGKEMEYNAWFDNCSFEITANYLGSRTFFKHIDLNQVNGIRFQGCDFSLSPDARGISHYNSAISSYSSGFKVSARCTGLTYPCNEFDRSTFTGFQCAISASNGSFKPYTFAVNRADFNNNSIGINVEGVNNLIIINSKFYLSKNDYSYESCSYGIYLNSSTGFSIEENKFFKASGAPLADYFGIAIINCESVTEIYKNEFTGLSVGNYAFGKNFTGPNPIYGLTYLCNQNTGNWADFYITGMETENHGIQGEQGSEELVMGNTFSPQGARWHFYNEKIHHVGYYYCATCPNENPDDDKIQYVTDKPVNLANACQSHYGGNNGNDIVLNLEQRAEREIAFTTASANYNNLEALYENLKDGGSTELKVSEINSATSTDMWTLRTQMLGDSPHLSDEVLKLVADKTEVFTEAAIFDILAANPDELKREELLKYLEEKENPLPAYMIDILRQVASGTSYKTVLHQQMARYSHERTRAANDIIRSILNDETLDIIQLRNWLDNLGGIESDKQIIGTYLLENNFTSAFALANLLPQLYNLQGADLEEHNRYIDMIQLQQILFNDGRMMDHLTLGELNMLNEYALTSEGSSGVQAMGILESFYGATFNNCKSLTDGEESFKNSPVNTNLLGEAYGLNVSVKPNPAKEFAAFDFTLPKEATTAILTITSQQGHVVERLELNGNKGQKLWDTRKIPSGAYIYVLEAAGFSKSGKLVIVK